MSAVHNILMKTQDVKVDEIRIDSYFPVDEGKVRDLAESIAEHGLFHPIMLNVNFQLIAGFHRVQAYKLLGFEYIRANIVDLDELDAELVKIEENLFRREFTRLERSEMLHRHKELYEQKHPPKQTEAASQIAEMDTPSLPRMDDKTVRPSASTFYEEVAEKMGVVPRTIQRDVQIAKDIPEDVRDLIRHTPIADNKKALLELSRREPEEQRRIAKKLVSEDSNGFDPLMSSATSDWHTPRKIIDRVRAVMGEIDLDPCSNSHDSPNVPATSHYTFEDDGLTKEWHGRVYMNPPYGSKIGKWTGKLISEFKSGRVTQAIALVPARTDTEWFRKFREYPRCFVNGRLVFSGYDSPAPFPSMIVALGCDLNLFVREFSDIGGTYQWIGGNGDG